MTYQLLFTEGWQKIPAQRPITQAHVAHARLLLNLHGTGCQGLKKSHHDEIVDDPYYVWSGKCAGNWALSLQHRDFFIDFSQRGTVRWCSKQSGFRRLHLIVKPQNQPWLISDYAEDESTDWRESTINIQTISWRLLDIMTITEGERVANVALHDIDAIGFTDLMSGGDKYACSRLSWLEVWGSSVPRQVTL